MKYHATNDGNTALCGAIANRPDTFLYRSDQFKAHHAKDLACKTCAKLVESVTVYETGATSHAVNDLILFTDNTKELAQLRDDIYRKAITPIPIEGITDALIQTFTGLLHEAIDAYKHEFARDPESYAHIDAMTEAEKAEYCRLYAEDFENWKKEHDL